jgi:hypothetical protein
MTRFHLTRRATIVGAAAAAVAAGGSAAALATSSPSGDAYQGCLNRALGALYNVKVNPTAPPSCFLHDTVVKWNQSGPEGAPGATGATGPAGPQGPTGATGPQGPSGTASRTIAIGSFVQVGAGGDGTATATCPSGSTATGGGFDTTTGIDVLSSVPASDGTQSWEVDAQNPTGVGGEFRARVVCVS